MNIVRRAKAEWIIKIAEWDADLRKRMNVINHHEFQKDLEKAELGRVKKLLGFVTRGVFPEWRHRGTEWVYRNRERVNTYHRNYYEKKRKEYHHEYYKKYYLAHKEELMERN